MAQIKRLVTFGCSMTYGHGLADCYNENGAPGPHPSIQAWPFVFASKFKIGLDNQGEAGASNKKIYKNILDYQFEKTDMVIVLWTYINRHCIFYPDHNDPIGPWINSTRSKHYTKYLFNDYDSTWQLLQQVDHTSKKFKNKNIYHYFCDWYMHPDLFDPKQNQNKMFLNDDKWKDTARDNLHPGRTTHIDFAEHILADPTGPAVALKDNYSN